MKRILIIILLSLYLPISASALDPFSFLVSPDPRCLEYKIVGICPLRRKIKVRHWIPVIFAEVVTSKGGSIFIPNSTPGIGTRMVGDEQAFEVRLWEVPHALQWLKKILGNCLLCSLGDARSGAPSLSEYPALLNSAAQQASGGACGVTDAIVGKLLTEVQSLIDVGQAKLVYDTALDSVNWATGCRDLPIAAAVGPAAPVACSAIGATQSVDSILGTNLTGLLPGGDICVGGWGPLYPRQMKTDSTEIIGAAHAAYRALHIARYNMKTLDFKVFLQGKLQHAFPVVSTCFRPGVSALEVELTTVASPTGSYGFFWWVPVTCCVGAGALAGCLAPSGTPGVN